MTDGSLALVYVEGPWAWFAEKPDEAWGDDWNDAPHDCNAGDPYTDRGGRLLKVAYDGDLEVAGTEFNAPSRSVEEINTRRLPWLYQPSYGRPQFPEPLLVIRALSRLSDFEQLVAQAGGKVYRHRTPCPRCEDSGEIQVGGESLNPRVGVRGPDPQCDDVVRCPECQGGEAAMSDGAYQQNARGEWVPSTPLPFYEKRPFRAPRYICQCGQAFKSEHRYNEHYLVTHARVTA